MEKINFNNGRVPALNETNLNKLQDNVEDAIKEIVENEETTSETNTYSCNYINLLNLNVESEINEINNVIYQRLDNNYNIDNIKTNGLYGIFNATGTLPSGYSQNDNNFFIETMIWYETYGRQILHDVRTTNTYIRNLSNNVWQAWKQINLT